MGYIAGHGGTRYNSRLKMSSNLPLLIVGFLALGAAVAAGTGGRWRFGRPVVVGMVVVAGLLWGWVGRLLPVRVTLLASVATVFWGGWTLDLGTWGLAGVVLLLVTAVLFLAPPPDAPTDSPWYPQNLFSLPVLALLSSAASLVAFWSDSPMGLLSGWAMVNGLWFLLLLFPGGGHRHLSWLLPGMGWLFTAVIGLWLAWLTIPNMVVLSVVSSDMPLWVTAVLLGVILLQMGGWPLTGWRPLAWPLPPLVGMLAHTLPVLAGVALLWRLAFPVSEVLLGGITAVGLLGLLAGVRLVWSRMQSWNHMAPAVALVQTSLLWLVGLWGERTAVLAEARVLVLATGLLLVGAVAEANKRPFPGVLAVGGALATIAGLPMTVGFGGRVGLYRAWLADGRWLLVLVLVLLLGVLITAVSRRLVSMLANWREFHLAWSRELVAVGLLLGGVVAWPGEGVREIRPFVWLAIWIPFLVGSSVSWFISDMRLARSVSRRAFATGWLVRQAKDMGQRWLTWVGIVMRELGEILEGEGGILWLVVFLVLFWLLI